MNHPPPHFSIEFESGITGRFFEVSGLESTASPGSRKLVKSASQKKKAPRLLKSEKITLKWGIIFEGDQFGEGTAKSSNKSLKNQSVIITLRNERGQGVMRWKLHSAFPGSVIFGEKMNIKNIIPVEVMTLYIKGYELIQSTSD